MRKINLLQIASFTLLVCIGLSLSGLVIYLLEQYNSNDSLLISIIFITLFYILMIIIFRLVQSIIPLKTGEIAENSSQEYSYHIYLLFFLLLFYPIMRSGFVPVPLMRLFYISLGAKLGQNTYSSGILFDPLFIQLGDNTIVGQSAMLIPHNLEGHSISHDMIRVGNNVTIGANAVVLSGVVIEDDAVIAVSAVVKRGTLIKKGEVWAGIPAVCIKKQ